MFNNIVGIFHEQARIFEETHPGFKTTYFILHDTNSLVVTVSEKSTGHVSTGRAIYSYNYNPQDKARVNDKICACLDDCYKELISKKGIIHKCNPDSKTIDILGTTWTLYEKEENEDPILKDNNGYCDYTVKKIVIRNFKREIDDYENLEVVRKRVIRHEIIHAFLFESGLMENMHCTLDESAHDEQMVDWIAYQFPKILEVFKNLDVL